MADLESIVRKYCPLVVFHEQEEFFCCTPEFYVDAATLVQVTEQGSTVPCCSPSETTDIILGKADTTVQSVSERTTGVRISDGQRLILADNVAARAGQADQKLSDTPVYCYLKRVNLPFSDVPLLELNYIFYLAFSAPYNICCTDVGGHDGDWEHITVRCTTEGKLVGVYYSAHRHGDGTWVAPKDVPVDPLTGRLLCFISLAAHAIYPTVGLQPRIFLLANDRSSAKGRQWGSSKCVIVAAPGSPLLSGSGLSLENLPEVEDRGVKLTAPYEGDLKQFIGLEASGGLTDAPVKVGDVQVELMETEWLRWGVRWGTIVPPQNQRWFVEAEHPTGSNPFKRTLLPCFRN